MSSLSGKQCERKRGHCRAPTKIAKGANNFGQRFDWRDRALYDYTNRFTDRGWAWEGLRRNREFQDAWQQTRSGFDWNRIGRSVTIVRAGGDENALSRWGVLYSDPPDIDARDAAVVWQTPSQGSSTPLRCRVVRRLNLAHFD